MQVKFNILLFCVPLFLLSCGGTVVPKNPLESIKQDYQDKGQYAVFLQDMDLQDKEQFVHKYKIIHIDKNNKVKIEKTDWKKVDDYFFYQHEDDLGMEILSRNLEGKYNNLVTPPGFSFLVGNTAFGSWTADEVAFENSEQTYWKFNAKDLDLEKELGLTNLKVNLKEYSDYKDKYLYNRPYYGETTAKDSTRYGTRSSHWIIIYPGFYSRRTITRNFYKPIKSSPFGGNRGGGGFGK